MEPVQWEVGAAFGAEAAEIVGYWRPGRDNPAALAYRWRRQTTNRRMIVPINRELQRQLLAEMAQAYPQGVDFNALPGEEGEKIINLSYLGELGLCDPGLHPSIGGLYSVSEATINASGLDFLADDGGVSAILNTITVRLHADTIRDMLAASVDKSNATPEEKSLIKKHLADLPEKALEAATTQLVGVGLRSLPDAIAWLRTLAGF